jgi:hypothetical protein
LRVIPKTIHIREQGKRCKEHVSHNFNVFKEEDRQNMAKILNWRINRADHDRI